MSDTIVENINQDALVDLFSEMTAESSNTTPKFGMENIQSDIFLTPEKKEEEKKEEEKNEESNIEEKEEKEEKEEGEKEISPSEEKEVDILGEVQIPEVKSSNISDLSSYYEDRIKSGKFVNIEDTDKDGKPISFIPKTPEEYDEVLDLQIQYKVDQIKKDLENNWYASKSPAWKAVSQYAEMVDDPSKLIPFLQGVKNIESVSNLDENEIDGAEKIVRTRLEQKGDTEEIIEEQIDALKTTDKLVSTAKLYKPIILEQEQKMLQNQVALRQKEEANYKQIISDIRGEALKAIESPIFGKSPLKQEQKALIYDLIAEPSEETSGYGIYNVIDNLFDKGDFERLKEVALLLSDRDGFINYLNSNAANATAVALERKLRVASESHSSSGNDFYEETIKPTVSRNRFKSKPTFGR